MDILGTYKDEPVVLQSRPQRRTISCIYFVGCEYVEDTYFLQFPYIIFCKYPETLSHSYCRVGFSPEPISSLDTKIYLPPLPNIDGFYAACGCGGSNIKASVEKFWQKKFKAEEVRSGESMLCRMFGLSYNELNIRQSNIRKAFRQWEKLDLDSFNGYLRASVNRVLTAKNFLNIYTYTKFLKLTF
jgi:hypothetical protein